MKKAKDIKIRLVCNPRYYQSQTPSFTFHGRDIMSPAAAHLSHSNGKVFTLLGPERDRLARFIIPSCQITRHHIRGKILYFDHFGNAMTNIRHAHAPESFWGKAQIFAGSKPLGQLRKTYGPKSSKILALFNSAEQLELAVSGGSVHLQGLRVGDAVIAKI